MKNLKTQFARIASVACLALGILGINQMASYSSPPITFVGSSSWASDGASTSTFYVTAQGTPDAAKGLILVTGSGYAAYGSAKSVSDSVSADGETAVVSGPVTFSHLANRQRVDSISAVATVTCAIAADGSQSEGVEIVDSSGQTLAHVPLEPVVRGSVEIFH